MTDQVNRTSGETMGVDQEPTEPGQHDGTQREQAEHQRVALDDESTNLGQEEIGEDSPAVVTGG
jgi:hypothetical protein